MRFLIFNAFRLSRERESLTGESRIMKRWDFGHLTSVAAFKILHQRNVRADLISVVIRGQHPLGGTFLLKVRTGSGWQGKGRSRSRTGHPLCAIQFPLRDGNRGDRRERKSRRLRGRADKSEIMEHLCPVSIHSALSLSLVSLSFSLPR